MQNYRYLHKHQLNLLQQHSESFQFWPASIRINTEGKSLIMKLGKYIVCEFKQIYSTFRTHTYTLAHFYSAVL